MKASSVFSSRAISVFFFVLIVAVVVNYVGSLILFNELRLALWADLLLALIAAFISYCSSLRKYLSRLEERIEALEWQSGHSR